MGETKNPENKSPKSPKSKEQKEKPEPVEEKKEDVVKKKKDKKDRKKPKWDPHDKREHLNLVLIGHVDAGKSTISGQILLATNQIDERTIAKYKKEAKEKNRESWWIAYIMDEDENERNKGKTVECGRAHFDTTNRRYTILDAPGHKNYVPNMISGAQQADVAILVISARKGEFEAGFDRGGQTREHALLVKTAGVKKLIVAINKMDEKTVNWSKDRYDECKKKLAPFLKKCGYRPNEVHILPISGQTGINMLEARPDLHPWYTEKPLIPYLDALPSFDRAADAPVRMPIVGTYSEMGVICIGKLESGTIYKG